MTGRQKIETDSYRDVSFDVGLDNSKCRGAKEICRECQTAALRTLCTTN